MNKRNRGAFWLFVVAAAVMVASLIETGCKREGDAESQTPQRADAADGSGDTEEVPPIQTPTQTPTQSPIQTPTQTPAPPATTSTITTATTASFLGLRAPKPATWVSQAPASTMRAAQFVVPGVDSSDAAHVVVFFFGAGQGGDVQNNIERWQAQFQSEEGGPVEPIVTHLEADGMPITLVELAGAWQEMGAASHKPGVLFLSAIVEAPAGSVFIRMVGPADVVERNREAFMAFLMGLERAEPTQQ